MSVDTRRLGEVLEQRREEARRLGRRLVLSAVIGNLIYLVNFAIVMENTHWKNQDDVAPPLALGWLAMNLLLVGWTRRCSSPAKALRNIDASLERGEDPAAPPPTPPRGDLASPDDAGSARDRAATATSSTPDATPSPTMAGRIEEGSPAFGLRALYFLFVGWWVGLAWGYIGLVLCLLVIPISAGQWMLRQIPQVMTLSAEAPPLPTARGGGPPFLLRALWFLVVGSWLGVVCFHLGMLLCLLVVPIGLGQKVLQGLPTVLTLSRAA